MAAASNLSDFSDWLISSTPSSFITTLQIPLPMFTWFSPEFMTSLRSLQLKMFCALTSSTFSCSSHSDPLVSFNATVEIPWLLLSRISLLQSQACSSLQLRLSFFKIPASSTFLLFLTHSSLHHHFMENPKPWAIHHWSSALLDLLQCHCYSLFSTMISPSSPHSPLNPKNTDENQLPNQEMQAYRSIHEKVSEDDDPTPPPRPSISSLACWSLFLKTFNLSRTHVHPIKLQQLGQLPGFAWV